MYNFKKIYEATHLLEKKDHLIKKIPELSEDEKSEVIDWFSEHPNRETEIDWNNINSLKFSDFEVLMKTESKTGRKNKVKVNGLQGLLEGTDFGLAYEDENIIGLVPFHYEASKLLASKYVGKVEAKWCTAFQKTDKHWKEYIQHGITFVYFINKKGSVGEEVNTFSWNKIAVTIYPKNIFDGKLETYDETDNKAIKMKPRPTSWLYKRIEKSIIDIAVEEAKLLGQKINRVFFNELSLESLKDWKINFQLDSEGKVNVEGDCDISGKFLNTFGTVVFGNISGDFDCSFNKLTDLTGGPQTTDGHYKCNNNKLTSLEGIPDKVGGDFDCSGNELNEIWSPDWVGGDIIDYDNNIDYGFEEEEPEEDDE